jgi:hypothetical protein
MQHPTSASDLLTDDYIERAISDLSASSPERFSGANRLFGREGDTGVYGIYCGGTRSVPDLHLMYVGVSTNLYRRMYTHWVKLQYLPLRYGTAVFRLLRVDAGEQSKELAHLLEKALITRLDPPWNGGAYSHQVFEHKSALLDLWKTEPFPPPARGEAPRQSSGNPVP